MSGEAEGLRELYSASYRRLVAQLAAMVGSVSEAEDLVQEAFVRAAGQWPRLSQYDSPEAWLRTVAMNLARSRWRRHRRAAAAMLRLRAGTEVVSPPPSADYVVLLAALRTLPAAQREALVLFHIADRSIDEIAAELGVPSGTVKARLARGRQALARQVGVEEPPADVVIQRSPAGVSSIDARPAPPALRSEVRP
jgi:RNA polymerase sigma-70 factor (ECF subfamily)